MQPADIRRLFQEPLAPFAGQNGYSPPMGFELTSMEMAQRTASLQQVLFALQQYWIAGSASIDAAAEILADNSRDASWRIPIGESGLLDFFLGILSVDGLRQSLKVNTLRLIGNSCADEDDNRARVVEGNYLGRIVFLLGDDSTLAFVIPVLYNICVDYGESREIVLGLQFSVKFADKCGQNPHNFKPILGLLISQEPEVALADPATPACLLQLATDPDILLDTEEFSVVVSVSLAYLTHELFQEALIIHNGVQSLSAAFADSYAKYDVSQLDPDDAADYKALGNRFMHIISDVVALPLFETQYSLNSLAVQMLQSWVSNPYANVNLKTAGCLALGNLARTDASSIYFVHDVKIHTPLIQLLSKPYDSLFFPDAAADNASPSSQLIYSVLSFLKNLAIPAINKPILGSLLDPPANILPRMWTSTDAQPAVQFAAVSLTRLLIVNCPVNVRRICTPLSSDPASPAHDRSNLYVLLSLFKRTDAENTKTEAARAIAAVCRVLHTSSDAEDVLPEDWEPSEDAFSHSALLSANGSGMSSPELPAHPPDTAAAASADGKEAYLSAASSPPKSSALMRRAHFSAAHVDMSDCFTYLITQTRFPVLRSEMWFVSALLSRSADGARLVMRALQPFEACRALVEAVSGRDFVEGHRLPGGASLFSDDDFSAAIDANGVPALLPPISPSDRPSDAMGAIAAETPSSVSSTDGPGLEPQQVDPAQVASMARIDRENGLVLITELMKNYAHFLPPFRRGMFEQLLQNGGALVISARSEADTAGAR
ncbi:hypothetical protein SEPCBS57363_001173 [Sporothrix epigloea]|uniref:GTP binding protein n=1 Tax=Sporothrix epigloea TaxID=1892477 RepID=A0ABP0D8U7_9PEZI